MSRPRLFPLPPRNPLRRRYEDMDWVKGRPPDALLYLKVLVKAAPLPLPPTLPPPPPLTAATTADIRAAAAPNNSQRGAETGPAHTTAVAAATDAGKDRIDGSVVASVNMPAPRLLAEGALLAPLVDVGTVAGALRGKIGGNLREMAAARCVGAID